MRTSLNNIKAIDDYLLGSMAPSDAILFEANMLLNSDLADDIKHQQSTYSMIRKYGRQKIKAEIMDVKKTLATSPQHRTFIQSIANLFNGF